MKTVTKGIWGTLAAIALGGCSCHGHHEEPRAMMRVEQTEVVGNGMRNVYFAFDRSGLTAQSKATVRENADWLKANPRESVSIEGHADERGTTEYNLALGEKRAHSAYAALKAEGIAKDRMSTISYGEEKPISSAHNADAWAKNRRVEFNLSDSSSFSPKGSKE